MALRSTEPLPDGAHCLVFSLVEVRSVCLVTGLWRRFSRLVLHAQGPCGQSDCLVHSF